MISPEVMASRIASFPKRYWDNFDYVWRPKIRAEANQSDHVLDENHQDYFYNLLRVILPRWQTYRSGDNSHPLKTLKESVENISEAYNQIHNFTLLEFDNIPREPLEIIWHELGRVKERDGQRNERDNYYAISVCKPLLLLWGQTLAFDTFVRKYLPKSYGIFQYSSRWTVDEWIRIMKKVSNDLNNSPEVVEFIKKESAKRYGKEAIVPYGRFLDIYYWTDSST